MQYIANSSRSVKKAADLDQAFKHHIGAIPDLTRIRFGRQVRHLHQLGERTLLEFMIEFVGADDNLMFDLQVLLDRYNRLTPKMIDRLDAREIRDGLIVVDGGRR